MTIYEKIANIQDEVEVRKEADNPFFHSKYATYEGVLNAIHSAMRKYNLVAFHSFEPSPKENSIVVITIIKDFSTNTVDGIGSISVPLEGTIESRLEIPLLKNDPQAAGSAITYAKRYSLLAILGLGTEDDDANQASAKPIVKATPENDVYLRDKVSKPCHKCGAPMAISAKGNAFCSAKCWLKE